MKPVLEITQRCVSCDACRLLCPEDSIIGDGKDYSIETWSCTLCGLCVEICPVDCISLISS